jgi:hypothetical protein
MAHLILSGDNTAVPGFSLLDETNLEITLDDTGTLGFALSFLVLSGPTSVSIASMGTTGGHNNFPQLDETKGASPPIYILGPFGSVCGKRIYFRSSCLAAPKISSRSAGLSAARASTTAPTIKAIETIAWSRPRSRFANPSRECSEKALRIVVAIRGTSPPSAVYGQPVPRRRT